MKKEAFSLALVFLLSYGAQVSYAQGPYGPPRPTDAPREKWVTPYGDFCKGCSTYGDCKKELTEKKAVAAIKEYFGRKGLDVGEVKGRGRFLKVEILKGGKTVDRVVFDKKTGRIRSIY